ncbi:MAG: class I SAM-dependent methyltransferase [archaeon]|jgi:ubiquinone/menaquinone biosynthesis C-methylase UbiE|nr:class I SAM-dependent methyltransferase [archaeon]
MSKPNRRTTSEARVEASMAAQRTKYARVQLSKGPATYWKSSGYNLLYRFAQFEPGKRYNMVDLMSGAGLFGKNMAKRAQKAGCTVTTTFVDITPEQLAKIRPTWTRATKNRPTFKTLELEGSYHRVLTRYGIKNYQPKEQLKLLKEAARLLSPGGKFVMQDMVSPEGLRGLMNAERRAKNRATGETITRPNLPTEKQWVRMIKQAGMAVEEITYSTSTVNTKNWVDSKQLTEDGVRQYISTLEKIMGKDPRLKKALKIKKRGNHYEITYPLILIRAGKAR